MSDCFDHESDALAQSERDDYESAQPTRCKLCHKAVTWDMTPAGWRLFEGKNLHMCDDPFKVVRDLETKNK